MSNLAKNVETVRERVAAAARRAGRNPDDITIVAVSKTRTIDEIREVLAAGLSHLGENKVQELLPKREAIATAATWHLIGSLQTNKAKQAVQAADLIHSLDRETLALELAKQAERAGRRIEALVQVNVSGEESKHGIHPDALPGFLRQVNQLDSIHVTGLMTMAPITDNPEEVRPVFRQLRLLSIEAAALGLPRVEMRHLSMGMSGDYEVAIEEGANLVRIGTALFGERQY